MAQRQSQSVVFIMGLYASLVDDAKEVSFLNKPGENPILDQLRGNFSGLLDAAIRANDLEVCDDFLGSAASSITTNEPRDLHDGDGLCRLSCGTLRGRMAGVTTRDPRDKKCFTRARSGR